MLLQERFDNITSCIEMLIYTGESDITNALSRETGLNLRLLGDAFQFMTDMTLIKYIRQRRLVCALKHRIEKNLSVEQVVAEAGFSDAAAFSKACKNEFNLSPSQITGATLSLYPPLSFAMVVSDDSKTALGNDTRIKAENAKTICGISADQFAEVKQILELSAVYGLGDAEAEFVYQLSRHCKITTAQAAEFYEDLTLQLENGSYCGGFNLFEMAIVSCQCDLSFSETQSLFRELKYAGYESIQDLPDGFFDIYLCEENNRFGWSVSDVCTILKTMDKESLSLGLLDDAIFYADTYGMDILEILEDFNYYHDDFAETLENELQHGTFDDDTDGFGYRSIWEFSE